MTKNRFFYLLMATLVAIGSLSLTACGDDDDEEDLSSGKTSLEDNVKGKITALYKAPVVYYAYTTKWETGHQEVHQTALDYLKNGATFEADLSESKPTEYAMEYGGHYVYKNDVIWTFTTKDEVRQGVELNILNSNWSETSGPSSWYWCNEFTGKVIVKSIKGSKITLEFQDFQLEYERNYGKEDISEVVVNGEITFDMKT